MFATAVAPLPTPAITTVGGVVYPDPPFVTSIVKTRDRVDGGVKTATASAPAPLGPAKETAGGAVYTPGLLTATEVKRPNATVVVAAAPAGVKDTVGGVL